jgi:hypothetical protein
MSKVELMDGGIGLEKEIGLEREERGRGRMSKE